MTYNARQLTDKEFQMYCALVYDECGIHLTSEKRQLLNARIGKRLRKLGVDAQTYMALIKKDAQELGHFVDAVSTNHTFFFRESRSFKYLDPTCKKIWCAAASSGEEPYSLAAYCHANGWSPTIFATDISQTCLDKASRGIYPLSAKNNIPADILKKCFQKGRRRLGGFMRPKAEIRNNVHFSRFNLLSDALPGDVFDIIFCRNVMIYFDNPTKSHVVSKLLAALKPKGYFIIGGAESLNGIAHPLTYVEPSVYMKP